MGDQLVAKNAPSTPELAALAFDAASDCRNAWICLCVGYDDVR